MYRWGYGKSGPGCRGMELECGLGGISCVSRPQEYNICVVYSNNKPWNNRGNGWRKMKGEETGGERKNPGKGREYMQHRRQRMTDWISLVGESSTAYGGLVVDYLRKQNVFESCVCV